MQAIVAAVAVAVVVAAAVTGAGSAHVNVFDLFLLLVDVLSSTLARACLAHRSRCTARLLKLNTR
jgi:hypothetical protein